VAPNRLLLLPLALVVGLGLGVAASFVASQLRPVFFDSRLLREVTGLPVLGSVSLLRDDAALRQVKAKAKRFFIALLGLIGAYGSGMLALALLTGRSA
jgi:uncharacterized protein involved in exopolysaccharide biosynthesis